jgi:large subunit ribosomal protein L4e
MKLKTMSTSGAAGAEVEMPEQFHEEVREDLIKKAFLAIQSNRRTAYGSFEDAGDRHVSWVSKRRRDWRGSYGKGISRVPRKVLSRRGSQMNWVGAQAPGTVGGRRAHPPKAEKVWDWKLNVKEKRKAIRSAMSATVIKALVEKRGHNVPASYPFIIDNSFESINKTQALYDALVKIGFDKELERTGVVKARTGRAKMRGRATQQKKGVLIVAHNAKDLAKAAENLPGIDVVAVKKLNVELLAPGSHYGRATLYTAGAVAEIKKGLFTKNYIGASPAKEAPVAKTEAAKPAAPKAAPKKKTAAKKE